MNHDASTSIVKLNIGGYRVSLPPFFYLIRFICLNMVLIRFQFMTTRGVLCRNENFFTALLNGNIPALKVRAGYFSSYRSTNKTVG
jgi:hypothetical protein